MNTAKKLPTPFYTPSFKITSKNDSQQSKNKIISLENKLNKPKKLKIPPTLPIYQTYEEDSIDEALRTGFDRKTNTFVEKKYLSELHAMNAWAYYDLSRYTQTWPYPHELRGKKAELKKYANHERAHAMGSVNEQNTEAFARDILDKRIA